MKPAIHIMFECDFVCTARHPDGIIAHTTFENYRPQQAQNPSLEDGYCDNCETRRHNISYIHRSFPENNPEYEYKGQKSNKSQLLDLWKKNPTKYPTVSQLLKKFDPLIEHPIRESKELKDKMKSTIVELNDLEKILDCKRSI